MNFIALDWLYENSLRSYPVRDSSAKTDGAFTLADNVILDAQFVFASLPSNFRLTQIVSSSPDVQFIFSSGLTFTALKNQTEPQYLRTSAGHLLVVGEAVTDIPNGTYNLNVYFEPSVINEFGGPWLGVSTISFDSSAPLTGIITWLEGYQFDIAFSLTEAAFNVGNLFGDAIGCTKFSSHPENCDDIISYICNAAPDGNNEIFIRAGAGMVVWDDPENHRIYVGFAFTSIKDICVDIPPFPI